MTGAAAGEGSSAEIFRLPASLLVAAPLLTARCPWLVVVRLWLVAPLLGRKELVGQLAVAALPAEQLAVVVAP